MLATFAKWFIDGVILMPLIMGGTKKNAVIKTHLYGQYLHVHSQRK